MAETPQDTPEDVIVDLWTAVYGEPPPVRAELSVMISALVLGLPEPVWSEDRHTASTSEPTEA